MSYPAHTVTAILGNLFSGPVEAVSVLGPIEALGAILVLTAAVAGLVAIRSVARGSAPIPAPELDYREAA